MAFKMKGMSFGNSPIKDQKANTETADKKEHLNADHEWSSHGSPLPQNEISALKNYEDMKKYSEPGDAVQFGDKDSPLTKKMGPHEPFDVDKIIEKNDPKVYVSDANEVGSWISEDEFESHFRRQGDDPDDYSQFTVQDYSRVKEDEKGKKYVEPR